MQILKEKTQYHEFVFRFEKAQNFPEVLDFCRALKETYGWQQFAYDTDLKGWVFSKPEFLSRSKAGFLPLR